MLVSAEKLLEIQKKYYPDLPLAYVFFIQFQNNRDPNSFTPVEVNNFFSRWDNDTLEIMFDDHSYIFFHFQKRKCYVSCASQGFFKEFPIFD